MAKKQYIQLIDDLDGSVIEEGAGKTVRFSLNGRAYEIDLSSANVEKLEEALRPFIAAGRSLSTGATADRSSARRSSGAKRDLAAIRTWAGENGFTVSTRGRIPEHVLAAYEAAQR